MKILLLICLLLTPPVSALPHGKGAERVDISQLIANPDSFLGKQVKFHGCLVSAWPHGEFVRPCNSKWRDLLIVSNDTFGNKSPYQELSEKTKSILRCVQANFAGLVVTSEETWPHQRLETTIKLTSYSGVARCPS